MLSDEGFEQYLSLGFPAIHGIAVVLCVSDKVEIAEDDENRVNKLGVFMFKIVEERFQDCFGLSVTVCGVSIEAANDYGFILEGSGGNDVVTLARSLNAIG